MTREEAIKVLENERACVLNDACQRAECANCALVMETEDVLSALDLALSALRGPTREMVERMRGRMLFNVSDWDGSWVAKCSRCGSVIGMGNKGDYDITRKFVFCPVCMAPFTDEAISMMLERWREAVDDEN